MIDRARVLVFLRAFWPAFVVVRSWLWLTPNADVNVAGYNIHRTRPLSRASRP